MKDCVSDFFLVMQFCWYHSAHGGVLREYHSYCKSRGRSENAGVFCPSRRDFAFWKDFPVKFHYFHVGLVHLLLCCLA